MTEDKLMNTCKICGFVAQSPRGVVFHSMKQHNIDRQQYYDMFYKRDGEGICPVCGKPTAFKGLTKGYHEHCSVHCALIDPNVKDKYKTTIQKHYGVEFTSGAAVSATFVPAYKTSNSEIGVYDKLSHTFYGNDNTSGTATGFTRGSDV